MILMMSGCTTRFRSGKDYRYGPSFVYGLLEMEKLERVKSQFEAGECTYNSGIIAASVEMHFYCICITLTVDNPSAYEILSIMPSKIP